MKMKYLMVKTTLAAVVLGWMCCSTGTLSQAQTTPANASSLSPDLQEVVALARQHMSDDVIINYIKSSGKSYRLNADDIIYLNGQGVSQGVISVLLQSGASNGTPAAGDNSPNTAPAAPATPAPDVNSAPPSAPPSEPAPQPAPQAYQSAPSPALQDNFYLDGGLNPALWQTQSSLLTTLATMSGYQVIPSLAFTPSGMQMSGTGGGRQFMGIQSTAAFSPPFTFTANVSGLTPTAIPFQVYLVSGDLQQWVSITANLAVPHREGSVAVGGFFGIFHGGVGIPINGGSPDYGVWINHTGNGQPISALGYRFFNHPFAGVPYMIQIAAGANGAASVTFMDSGGNVLAAQNVPVGIGPFYVVLAGRNGRTVANWQSVQVVPTGPPVVEPPAAPATPTMDYFQSQLSPYGNWVNVPGYGLCWQPVVDAGWRPYYEGGHWEYTDAGWYWQSDYPWGDIAFHYGRWTETGMGWVWVPGYDYAPSWVVWRHADADGCMGWAPLPPGAVFINGGWNYNGVRVGADFDFGLRVGVFTFVGYDHFWDHDYRRYALPPDRVEFVFGRSRIENHYRMDHGHFVNEGLGHDHMEKFTHRDFRAEPLRQVRVQEERRNLQVRHDDIQHFQTTGKKFEATRTVSEHGPIRTGPGAGHPGTPNKTPGNGQNFSSHENSGQPGNNKGEGNNGGHPGFTPEHSEPATGHGEGNGQNPNLYNHENSGAGKPPYLPPPNNTHGTPAKNGPGNKGPQPPKNGGNGNPQPNNRNNN